MIYKIISTQLSCREYVFRNSVTGARAGYNNFHKNQQVFLDSLGLNPQCVEQVFSEKNLPIRYLAPFTQVYRANLEMIQKMGYVNETSVFDGGFPYDTEMGIVTASFGGPFSCYSPSEQKVMTYYKEPPLEYLLRKTPDQYKAQFQGYCDLLFPVNHPPTYYEALFVLGLSGPKSDPRGFPYEMITHLNTEFKIPITKHHADKLENGFALLEARALVRQEVYEFNKMLPHARLHFGTELSSRGFCYIDTAARRIAYAVFSDRETVLIRGVSHARFANVVTATNTRPIAVAHRRLSAPPASQPAPAPNELVLDDSYLNLLLNDQT